MAYDPYGQPRSITASISTQRHGGKSLKTGQRELVYAIAPDDFRVMELQIRERRRFDAAAQGLRTGWARRAITRTSRHLRNFMERGTLGGFGDAEAPGGAGLAGAGWSSRRRRDGVYGLSGIESAAAPGFTYGTAGAGGTAAARGTGVAAAAGPG
jgi:hypothetical protein